MISLNPTFIRTIRHFLSFAIVVFGWYASLCAVANGDESHRRLIMDPRNQLVYRLPKFSASDWGNLPTDYEKKHNNRHASQGYKEMTLVDLDYNRWALKDCRIIVKVTSPNTLELEERFRRNLVGAFGGKFISSSIQNVDGQHVLTMSYRRAGWNFDVAVEKVFMRPGHLLSVTAIVERGASNSVAKEIDLMFDSIVLGSLNQIRKVVGEHAVLIDEKLGFAITKLPGFRFDHTPGQIQLRSWSVYGKRKISQQVTLSNTQSRWEELEQTLYRDLQKRDVLRKRSFGRQTYSRQVYEFDRTSFRRLSVFQQGEHPGPHCLYELLSSNHLNAYSKTEVTADTFISSDHVIQHERRRWSPLAPLSEDELLELAIPREISSALRPKANIAYGASNTSTVSKMLCATERVLGILERDDANLRIAADYRRQFNFLLSKIDDGGTLTQELFSEWVQYFVKLLKKSGNKIASDSKTKQVLSETLADLVLEPDVTSFLRKELELTYEKLDLGSNKRLLHYYSRLLTATRKPNSPARTVRRRKNSKIEFVRMDNRVPFPQVGDRCVGEFLDEFQNIHLRIRLLERAAILRDQAIPLLCEVMSWNDYPLLDMESELPKLALGEDHFFKQDSNSTSNAFTGVVWLKSRHRFFLLDSSSATREFVRIIQRNRVMSVGSKLLAQLAYSDGKLKREVYAQILSRKFSTNSLAAHPKHENVLRPLRRFSQNVPWDKESLVHLINAISQPSQKSNYSEVGDLEWILPIKELLKDSKVIKSHQKESDLIVDLNRTIEKMAIYIKNQVDSLNRAKTELGRK